MNRLPRLVLLCLTLLLAAAGPLPARALRDSAEVAERADALLRAGYPWRATELLDSALRVPEQRTPKLVLLAARAAAGWKGWSRVETLLAREPWLDSLGGEGHTLLARAALARGDYPVAAARARRALATAPGELTAERMVLLAMAFDRIELRDSAAGLYRDAAAILLPIADWLLLRSAAVTDDPDVRSGLIARVTRSPAVDRIRWTEARARVRAGRRLDAARLYDSLGAPVEAMRLRLAEEIGGERGGIRRALVAVLDSDAGPAAGRLALELLDRHFSPLTPAEQLAAARRAARNGDLARAASGYAGGDRAGLLTAADRFSYGGVLSRLGRYDDAQTQFSMVRDSTLRGQAQYQRARTLMLAGRIDGALGALGAVARLFRHDTTAAGTALYLTGDLRVDRGQDSAAREAFRALGARYPTHPFAARALLRAALIAFRQGDLAVASRELDSLRLRTPRHRETWAATYWSGRALWARGDSGTARIRWNQVLTGGDDYYALLAARALGRRYWSAPDPRPSGPVGAPARAALARIRVLERLGLDEEAGLEWTGLLRAAESGREAIALAAFLDSAGYHGRAFRLATRAGFGNPLADGALVRLLHPLPRPDALLAEADRNALDPLLVAALIRQESAFDHQAVSRAGARGLMQMLPSVGAVEARGIGLEVWDPVLLFEPDVNLRLGTRHLATALAKYPHLEHGLAAYNAGGSRVDRWIRTAGVEGDPELFVERIPYIETRDYVRRVLVNLERYRSLYGGGHLGDSATLR